MGIRTLAGFAASLLMALSATAEHTSVELMALTEVATDTPITVNYDSSTVTRRDADHGVIDSQFESAYITVVTTNETATASLILTVFGVNDLGAYLICTSTAITTETTTTILLGSLATAAGGIADACDFPLPKSLRFVFTTTGVGADFDVQAGFDSAGP